jgi:Nif-specific regulatory protein
MEHMAKPRTPAPAPTANPSVLWAVGDRLSRAVDVDALLMELSERIASALQADRCTIYLLDVARGELSSRGAKVTALGEIRLQMGQGVAGAVAATGQTLNLPDADHDARVFRQIDQQTGYKTRTILATPMLDRQSKVLGVVQVLNAKHGRFSENDADNLRRLAAEVAVAIESTTLYQVLHTSSAKAATTTKKSDPAAPRYNGFVGQGAAMRKVYVAIAKAAPTQATVLVRGESGTGKALVAKALHDNGPRRAGPFVMVDCTTIPESLMESALFGHEKGAFTGATERATGFCETAAEGTLFLDEIGELPLPLQAKLLRFIQDREFERVGGRKTLTANARVVAATHRDLESMVGRGQFRADLYYRIKVVQVTLPALRDRDPQETLDLADHFLATYGRKHRGRPVLISAEAKERLLQHRWPGNVRELEHCIESAVVMCEGDMVAVEHLAIPFGALPSEGSWQPESLEQHERLHIERTVAHVGGNLAQAARLLAIGRNTLYRKLEAFGHIK